MGRSSAGAARRALSATLAAAFVVFGPISVGAMAGPTWTHDHSVKGIPYRPDGYSDLVRVFGKPCSDSANDGRSYFPHAVSRDTDGYVYFHTYIARDVGYNIRGHITTSFHMDAVDYGVYGYNCRYISGSTSWSAHAFGAAVDTNTARNPSGQDFWNGKGADGVDYDNYIPNLWKGDYPGHNFHWGLHFSTTPDPMHFQYVTGY
ncbi:MAG: M15 family metallopeptidase [Actinomycetota bacterium]|nr:M15 family metallopeptidase [Actinomycetota bacterium]